MAEHKEPQKSQKPTITPENHEENVGQRGDAGVEAEESRGEAVRSAGNKVHGDKLEGLIGSGSQSERANQRPTRDDGDNDDEGPLR